VPIDALKLRCHRHESCADCPHIGPPHGVPIGTSCEERKAAENASMKQSERMMMWQHIMVTAGSDVVDNEG